MVNLNYQTAQVFFGGLHPNVLLNSGKFDNGTRTLKYNAKECPFNKQIAWMLYALYVTCYARYVACELGRRK